MVSYAALRKNENEFRKEQQLVVAPGSRSEVTQGRCIDETRQEKGPRFERSEAFLHKRLSFTGIFDVVGETVARLSNAANITSVEDVFAYDAEARRVANELLNR